jgi:hypothetical protein
MSSARNSLFLGKPKGNFVSEQNQSITRTAKESEYSS